MSESKYDRATGSVAGRQEVQDAGSGVVGAVFSFSSLEKYVEMQRARVDTRTA